MGGPWAGARPGLRPQCCRGGLGSLHAGRVPAAPSNTGVDGSRGDPEPRHAGLRVTATASGSLQSSLPKNFNESFTRSWSEAGKTLTERGARPQCRRVSFGSPASWGRLSVAGPRQALGPRPATGEQGRLGAHSVPGTGRHRAQGRVGGEQSGAGSPAAAVHPALLAARPGPWPRRQQRPPHQKVGESVREAFGTVPGTRQAHSEGHGGGRRRGELLSGTPGCRTPPAARAWR